LANIVEEEHIGRVEISGWRLAPVLSSKSKAVSTFRLSFAPKID
jgi:hypothetical protein